MAHRILGVDLGAWSVKVAVVAAGFRRTAVIDWMELPVPPAAEEHESLESRQARAVGELVRARGFEHDFPFATMAGDTLSIRILDFPFQNLKRVELDKAVGAELEMQLPHELEDIVYGYDSLPRGAEPGTRILAAATTRERVARLLELFGREGAEPHGVLAAPTAYGRVVGSLAAAGGPEAAGDTVLLVDHGHARTNVCIVREKRVVFARTLSRGGRNLTAAIARVWGMSLEEAERAKHSDGFVASSREPAPSDAWARISEVLKPELQPLVRELRQTMAACQAATGHEVARAILTGGSSRLRGLPGHLADELGLPVGVVTADDAARLLGPSPNLREVPLDIALLALGTALEGASGRPAFDLRQGPLAYKHDFSFLRARAGYLAACVLLLGAFFAGNAYAALYKLRAERDILDKRLETTTTEIFGAPVGLDEVDARLAPQREESPLPKLTAFDLLVEMSKHLPPRTEGKLDVLQLDIEPKKVFIKAIADSSATIDAVAKKLKEIECFGEIQSPRTDTVSDGKQFTFTIPMKCMW